MNNETERKNVNEIQSEVCAVKKRKRNDVFVLILIVFFVAFALIGLTVKREQLGLTPSNKGETVSVNRTDKGTDVRSFRVSGYFDENGEAVETFFEGGEGDDRPQMFKGLGAIYEDEEGRVTLDYNDGRKVVHEKGTATLKIQPINLDEAFGAVPASADDLVNKATEKAASNLAYAATGVGGGYGMKNKTWYTIGSGGGSTTWGGKVGKNQTSYSETYFAFYLQDGTWYKFVTANLSTLNYNAGWSTGSNGNWNGGAYGWAGAERTTNVSGSFSNGRYFVFYCKHYKSAGGGKNDSAQVYSQLSNCWLNMYQGNNDQVTFGINQGSNATWAYSKYAKFYAQANKAGVYNFTISFTNGNGNAASRTTNGSNFSTTLYAETGANNGDRNNQTKSGVSASATAYTSTQSWGSFSASQLGLDSGAPVIDDVYIKDSSGNRVSSVKNLESGAKLVVVCHDKAGTGYASGIIRVKAVNDRDTSNIKENGSVNQGAGGSSVTVEFNLYPKKEEINGTWSIYVYDKTNKDSQRATRTFWFDYCDVVKPTISNVSITHNAPSDGVTASINNQTWTRQSLNVNFKASDYAYGTRIDRARINEVQIVYTINGKSFSVTTGSFTKSNVSNNGYGEAYSATLRFGDLRFDPGAITSMTLIVKDGAGNKAETKIINNGAAQNGCSIQGRLDTISPGITSVKVLTFDAQDQNSSQVFVEKKINKKVIDTGMTTSKIYAFGRLRLEIGVTDFGSQDKAYYSGTSGSTKKVNNGSGVSAVYFYTDANCTKPLPINGQTGGEANKYSIGGAGINIEQKAIADIYFDTKNTDFNGTVYIKTRDVVGNESDKAGGTSTVNWDGQNALGKADDSTYKGANGVYVYQGVKGVSNLGRDSFKPQIVIKDKNGNILASTIADENGTAEFNVSSVKKVSRNYLFPWQKHSGVAGADLYEEIYIDVYYGSSGGKMNVLVNGQEDKSSYPEIVVDANPGSVSDGNGGKKTALGNYTFAKGNNSPTQSNAKGGWEESSTTYVRNPSYTSYSYGMRYSTKLQLKYTGKTYYTIRFQNNAGVSTDDTSGDAYSYVKDEYGNNPQRIEEVNGVKRLADFTTPIRNSITVVTQMDVTKPIVEFVGIKDETTGVVINKDTLLGYSNNSWLYALSSTGFKAIFKVAEDVGGSGLLEGITGKNETTVLNYADTITNAVTAYGTYGRVPEYTDTDVTPFSIYGYNGNTRVYVKKKAQNGRYVYDGSAAQATSGVSLKNAKDIEKKYEKINNSTENLPTAGYRFEFKYTNESNGHSYGYTETGYIAQISFTYKNSSGITEEYVGDGLEITMYDKTKMQKLSGFYDSKTKNYDVTPNTYLRYKLAVTDYAGNIGYASFTDATRPADKAEGVSEKNEWGDNIIRLYVDPFPVSIRSIDFYEAKSNSWSDENFTKLGKTAAEIGEPYKMTANRNDGWAHNNVFAELVCNVGLSGINADYRYRNMVGEYKDDGNPKVPGLAYSDLSEDKNSAAGGVVLYNGNRIWIVFSNSATKDVQVALGVSNNAVTLEGNKGTDAVSRMNNLDFYVRQDVTNPNIEKIFLSAYNTYASAIDNVLLTFDAKKDDKDNYEFVLNIPESPAYKDNGLKFIYSARKTYLFIVANDKSNELEGSGIETVTFDNKACTLVRSIGESRYYVSSEAYAYDYIGTSGLKEFYIHVADKQGNEINPKYGHSTENGYGYRMLPVLDEIDPFIKLNKAIFGTESYVKRSTETGSDRSGRAYTIDVFDGKAIKSQLTATFDFEIGISGFDIYFRRTDYETGDRLSDLNYFVCGNYLPKGYDLKTNGWGYYSGSNWITADLIKDNYEYRVSYAIQGGEYLTGLKSGGKDVTFGMESAKERIELLFVSGTGKYYVIELGQIYIDMRAPDVHAGMTTFSVSSDADEGDEIKYDALQKIWTTEVGYEYTNGDVYIYYYVTDPSSGIIDEFVLSDGAISVGENDVIRADGGTRMEKITVKGVPVYTVDGVPVSVRRITDAPATIDADDKGILTINGYEAFTLNSKAEKIMYKGGETIGEATVDLTFYRIKVVSAKECTITAVDNARNVVSNAPKYYINIDKTGISMSIEAKTDETENYDYSGEKFTNRDVEMRWYARYGFSGFGGFTYKVYDKLLETQGAEKFVNIPQFNKSKTSGRIVMTYYDAAGKRISRELSLNWKDGFEVTVSGRNWMVGSLNTNVPVNETVYGDLNDLIATRWSVNEQSVYMYLDRTASYNRYEIYTATAKNSITADYAVGRVIPSTEVETFSVKIDIVRPEIDMSRGNLPELLDGMAKGEWHALAKSIRIYAKDDLSGIGLTGRQLDENTFIENVKITFRSPDGGTREVYFIKDATEDDFGLYRAYETEKDGYYQKITSLMYLNYYTEYTIGVVDEAGNETSVNVTPYIDTVKTTIESIGLFDEDGNEYKESDIGVSWVKDVAQYKFNWSDKGIYAEIQVLYGLSGYSLQYRSAVKNATLNAAAAYGAWTTVDESKYTVIETIDLGNGTKRDVIRYAIADGEDYSFAYYKFRAISKAQRTELEVYKSYVNSEANRATEDGKGNVTIELEAKEKEYENANSNATYENGRALVKLGENFATGCVAIDKNAPDMEIYLYKQDGYKTGGVENFVKYGDYVKIGDQTVNNEITVPTGEWSKEQVKMSMSVFSDSNFASGNVIYYRSSSDGGNTWNEWTLVYSENGKLYSLGASGVWADKGGSNRNVTINNNVRNVEIGKESERVSWYSTSLAYLIKESQNNVMYEFYAESGAGLCSKTYRFGTVNAGVTQGIKIDTNKAEVSTNAISTFVTYTDEQATQAALAKEYNDKFLTDGYLLSETAAYTQRDTVVVRIQIQKIGYSGARVIINENGTDRTLDTITYDEFVAERNDGGQVYRYYRITRNGETRQTIRVESIAGTRSDDVNVFIRIDNTTPIIFVSEINGTKATNWGWTGEGKNLYTDAAEYWYVSELGVTFGIGRIEKGSFVSEAPYSGYVLEYSLDGGEWMPLAEDRIVIDGITVVEKSSYRFRITSGSTNNKLITYELGKEVVDNKGETLTESASGLNYKDVLNDKIKTVTGIDAITAHAVKNGQGDADDGSYVYTFSVDSNNYYYDYFGKVDLGNGSFDTRTGEFMTYVVRKADSDNVFDVTTSTQFRRGDVLEIEYVAKFDGVNSGAKHNYFQNYTVSTAGERVITHNAVNDMFGLLDETDPVKRLEKTGKIKVQFEHDDLLIESYFIAEVDVTYGKDEFFLQTEQGEYKTTGTSVYNYKDGSTDLKVNVSLDYKYYEYFAGVAAGTKEPVSLGAYFTVSSVTANTGAFRVTKNTERKDFVLKYFATDENHETVYNVNNGKDFGFIDKNYYNLNADGTVDETVRTYLDHDYILNADITAVSGLKGTYKGTFDGNNRNIEILPDPTVTDDYGLFEKVSGTVKSFNVTPKERVIIDTDKVVTVGFVAKELVSGGKIDDVTVIADVLIRRMAEGSTFAGLVAVSDFGSVGYEQSVLTDVRITNEGNALSNVTVSSVIGKMKANTVLSGAYAFGEIELYNVTDVKAGILYGDAEIGSYRATVVKYFDNNVFINGNTVVGASTEKANVTVTGECVATEYDEFVAKGTKSTVIGGVAMDEAILARLYRDFGYEYDETVAYGKGTTDSPLVISTIDHIRAINGYMNLNFVFGRNVGSIDMSEYDCSVAITKVFNGSLSTQKGDGEETVYTRLSNFAGNIVTYSKNTFGLFGQLNGKVSDVIFDETNINFEYTGAGVLSAGLVAAKALSGAEIRNLMFIGSEKITAANKTVKVATVASYVEGATITDIFDVNNIAVNAYEAVVGGIAAETNGIVLPGTSGSVFVLGRAEAYGIRLTVGSVIGRVLGSVTGGNKVYAIKDNVYVGGNVLTAKPVGSSNDAYGMITESFSSDSLRSAEFASIRGSVFNYVFNNVYPISGDGSSLKPFVINSEKDFGYIDLMLYAEYSIEKDIEFVDFKTIGTGLVFSGVLKGNTGDDISVEGGKIISLKNVTAPLVYNNVGKINDLSVNVEYKAEVGKGETFRYGAIAVISEGEIKNVTVAGNVEITSKTQDTTLYVSGFVAESRGGGVEGEFSKLQNSISALNIKINGGGTVYTGGYAAIVTNGSPKFSYGIATGSITVNGAKTTYAGLLVGLSHGVCNWQLGENASVEYTYTVTIDGTEIEKFDEEGNPKTENFCGLTFAG